MKTAIAILTMLACSNAWAISDLKTAAVSVSVSNHFSLTLTGPNAAGINFGAKNGGDSDYQVIGLSVEDNHGMVWTIALSGTPLTHVQDGVTQMPASALKYNISGGAGVAVPASGVLNVPATPTTIYTAALAEWNSIGLALGLGIELNVPLTQKNGDYSTILNITLSDAF